MANSRFVERIGSAGTTLLGLGLPRAQGTPASNFRLPRCTMPFHPKMTLRILGKENYAYGIQLTTSLHVLWSYI
jgi:hypothetical protein